MAVPTPNQYWIRPDALTFSLNTPDVDYLRVSVLAGSAIIAYMEGVIDYDPSHNHRKWPIQAADTFLETTEPYYVHAQLTRSESTPTALIVYSLTKRSITGKIIEEDGTETGEEDQDYFYVYLGKISSSIDKNGQKVGRTWIEAYNPGKLDTNQGRAEDMDGHYLSKLFDDIARGVITFENGIRFGNLLLALEGNDTLFLKNTLTGEQANFAASGAIATKGIGTSSGSGGVVPWSELENSIIPKVTDTYSIGTNTNKWQSIYAIEGHINSLVAHALNAESIKLNGKDVATKEYVIAMVAQGGGGGGTGGSSTVSYLPTIEEGKEIGTLIVDGVSYGLFAPSKYSWEEIDDKPNFAKVAFSGSYNDLTDVPTIPTIVGLASEEWVNTQLVGYQKKITSSNKLSYALISGTPTSLPASDVSAWAKADSKPSYSWNEINSRPTKLSEFTDDVVKGVYQPLITTEKKLAYTLISGVPTSLKNPYSLKFGSKSYDGSSQKEITASDLGALTSHQTIYTLTIQKNGTNVGTFTPNSKDETINIDGVVTLSDEQEITGRKTFTGGVRLNSNTVIRNAQLIGTNASDAVLWKVDNTGNATFVNEVLGGTLSVTKESTFTGETTHNGGIVIPSGKTLKIGNTVIEEKDGGLFVNGDLAASGSVATKGVGSSSGGGGNSYGRLDNWDNYNASNGDVLSALLGYGLKSDIATLTSKFNNYFTKNETRNEIVAYLNDFNDEMIIPNYSTKSEVGSLADVVGGIGTRVSTLEGKATAVSFAQTLQSGKQIGVLTIDGTPTTLFAPAGYAWGEITSRPTKLSDFTDDVVSGKYLSLSGGTLSGNIGISSGYDAKIILNETGSDSKYQYIAFQDNGVVYGMLGTFGNNNLVWNGETIIHRGNYTEYTYSKEQVDTKFSSVLKSSMLTNVALDDINAIDGDENRWNNSSKSFVLVNFNNAIAFTVGGVNNNRAANIQVGHSIGEYAQHLGTLYLNKLGGDVYIGENLAIHEGNIGSQSVESANRLRCIMNIPSSGFDANTSLVGGGYIPNYSDKYRWGSTMPSGMSYGVVYQLQGSVTGEDLAGQLAWDVNHKGADSTNKLWWRANDDTGFVNAKWHQIAFTDSNVASADKATRDGNGNVIATTYLPLGGGTINGNLTVTGRVIEKGLMEFHYTDGTFVYLAHNKYSGKNKDGKTLAIYNGTTWYDILHSGNIGNYALPLSGGTMTGRLTIQGAGTAWITFSDSPEQTFGAFGLDKVGPKYWDGNAARYLLRDDNYTDYTYSKAQVDTKLGDYLPLGGGTISGDLTIGTSSTTEKYYLRMFCLQDSEVHRLLAGITDTKDIELSYYSPTVGTYARLVLGTSGYKIGGHTLYDIIHSGNIGRQSVSYATSSGTANILNKIYSENINYDAYSSHVKLIKYNSNWQDNGFPRNHTSGLSVQAGYVGWQMLVYGGYTDTLYFRKNHDDSVWGDWKTIAFTDSNVASADKLSDNTAYTAWGQTFFENGKPKNVSGNLSLGTSRLMFADSSNTNYKTMYLSDTYGLYIGDETSSKYNTSIWGDNLQFVTGTNGQIRLCIKNNGNVLIGTTTDNGYKLYVNDNSYFNGTLNASGNVTLGSTLSVGGITTCNDYLLLTGTGASTASIRFSREGANYIIFPETGYLTFASNTSAESIWYRLSSEYFRPQTSDKRALGGQSYRWSNVYSVLGNFSGDVTIGGKLSVASSITSSGAITIKDTVFGIGATGVIRGSKVISEGAIETSTLKVGSILIEDKDGDLFINGNLAASGSVATKGIGSSSGGGSATIPWSALENSLIAASTSYNLGSSAKPWGSVYANSGVLGTLVSSQSGVTLTSYVMGQGNTWQISANGSASFASLTVGGANVGNSISSLNNSITALQQSTFTGQANTNYYRLTWFTSSGGNRNVDIPTYQGKGFASIEDLDGIFMADYKMVYDILDYVDNKLGAYATTANTYTKTQVNNNFAAKSEAEIVYSVSVTGDRNVAPSLNLDCGNGVWSLRNVFNGTNGDLKFLFDTQQKAQLTTAGDLSISGRLTQSSDETLKNILGYNVDMKVRDIANAPICYFTWKDRVSERQIGTIAQYWKLITPECVVGEEGRMSMDYSTLGLVSSIINAREIVKHEDEIEALKRRVKELEDKLAAVSAA